MIIEIIKFFVYAILIVMISKYILVKALRRLAENLNLKPQTVGNISGIATSIPEFLTVTISSFQGLASTSLYNIISSNIINLAQYILSLIINKNYRLIKNKVILIQLILVILTIIIPILLINLTEKFEMWMIFIFIILYLIFSWISKKIHEKYLEKEEQKIEEYEKIEELREKNKNKRSYVYIVYIVVAGIMLYFIGNELGNVLENLSEIFKIAEYILGILLGAITSVPELVTFFEAQKHYKDSENDKLLGVVEATNNLLTSNMLNLFIIQSLGIFILL